MYENVIFRCPASEDGPAMREIARESQVLSVNSGYFYALMARHFKSTCLVAALPGRICGYVAGYSLPGRSGTLFIWQIGVAQADRGQGLGKKLLTSLVDKKRPVFLEATIDPKNQASINLFTSVARHFAASHHFGRAPFFTEKDLGAGDPAEHLMAIGPFVP